MAYLPKNAISIASLAKPPRVSPPAGVFHSSGEQTLFDAYEGNLASADALASSQLHHDAWISLNLAVECFFKYAFCILRAEIHAVMPPVTRKPGNLLEYDGTFIFHHKYALDKAVISAKEFGHEIHKLWDAFDQFTDLQGDPDFNALKNHLPLGNDWVVARYSPRQHNVFKPRFEFYREDFRKLLAGALRGLS